MNKIIRFITLLMIIIMMPVFVYAKGRWVNVDNKWKYEVHSGGADYVSERFREIDSKVYYFDYYGYMVTGPTVINGNLHIFDESGAAVSTGFDIDGVHYETMGNGKVEGLPLFFDLSMYPSAASSVSFVAMNAGSVQNLTDENNNITPTAAPATNE